MAEYAFKYAQDNNRQSVTAVHKVGSYLPARSCNHQHSMYMGPSVDHSQRTHLCTELCPRTILPEACLINAMPSTLSARLLRWPGKAQKCAKSPGLLQHER